MKLLTSIARNPAAIGLVAVLALAGCANKKTLPNSPGELGLAANGAGAGLAAGFYPERR